jgi:hypothetical protein
MTTIPGILRCTPHIQPITIRIIDMEVTAEARIHPGTAVSFTSLEDLLVLPPLLPRPRQLLQLTLHLQST